MIKAVVLNLFWLLAACNHQKSFAAPQFNLRASDSNKINFRAKFFIKNAGIATVLINNSSTEH